MASNLDLSRSKQNCKLHPLIPTTPFFTTAQHVEKKKTEPKTPHFLGLNQDIVA